MKDEIKEILKCLEMDMLDNKQIEKLLDYITNLEQENNILKRDNEALRKYYNHLVDYILSIENKDIYIEEKYDSED